MQTELAAGVVLNCGIYVMCDGGVSCLSTTYGRLWRKDICERLGGFLSWLEGYMHTV